jgi:hypothetical protein
MLLERLLFAGSITAVPLVSRARNSMAILDDLSSAPGVSKSTIPPGKRAGLPD